MRKFFYFSLLLFFVSCSKEYEDVEFNSGNQNFYSQLSEPSQNNSILVYKDGKDFKNPCLEKQEDIFIEDYTYNNNGLVCYEKIDFMKGMIEQMMIRVRCMNQLGCEFEEYLGSTNGIWVGSAGCRNSCSPYIFEIPCIDSGGNQSSFTLFNQDGSIERQNALLNEIYQQVVLNKPGFECEQSIFRIKEIYLDYLLCLCPTHSGTGEILPPNLPCDDLQFNPEYHLGNTSIFVNVDWYCCSSKDHSLAVE